MDVETQLHAGFGAIDVLTSRPPGEHELFLEFMFGRQPSVVCVQVFQDESSDWPDRIECAGISPES